MDEIPRDTVAAKAFANIILEFRVTNQLIGLRAGGVPLISRWMAQLQPLDQQIAQISVVVGFDGEHPNHKEFWNKPSIRIRCIYSNILDEYGQPRPVCDLGGGLSPSGARVRRQYGQRGDFACKPALLAYHSTDLILFPILSESIIYGLSEPARGGARDAAGRRALRRRTSAAGATV